MKDVAVIMLCFNTFGDLRSAIALFGTWGTRLFCITQTASELVG
jgi:hypothetical protein